MSVLKGTKPSFSSFEPILMSSVLISEFLNDCIIQQR